MSNLSRREALATTGVPKRKPLGVAVPDLRQDLDKGLKPDWEANWEAIKSRVATVARALKLPDAEVTRALKYNGRSVKYLCEFSLRYNQSLDWLILGDVESLCHGLAWADGWRPADWTPAKEKSERAARKHAKEYYLPLLTKPRPRKAA